MKTNSPTRQWRKSQLQDLVFFQRGFDITLAQQNPGPYPVISSSMALLEESARLPYREWFVRLRFPGHEHTRILKRQTETAKAARDLLLPRLMSGEIVV